MATVRPPTYVCESQLALLGLSKGQLRILTFIPSTALWLTRSFCNPSALLIKAAMSSSFVSPSSFMSFTSSPSPFARLARLNATPSPFGRSGLLPAWLDPPPPLSSMLK